jgi:hypothetical protein
MLRRIAVRSQSGAVRFRASPICALENKTPPNFGDVLTFGQCRSTCRLGRRLLHHLRLRGFDRGADLDRARLGCLGHFANHIDRKHAIVEAGARHLHVVGNAKAPLEAAPGDATVQLAAAVLVLLLRLAGDQSVFS